MTSARLALLVGTDTYQDQRLDRLPAVVADVNAVAAVLGDPTISDFTTTILKDAASYEVAEAIEGFFVVTG